MVADALSCFLQKSQTEEKTLRDENFQIFHHLQTSLTRANIIKLSLSGYKTILSPLYQVYVFKTHVLSRLCQFWIQLWDKLALKGSYKAIIEGQVYVRGLKLRLVELQTENSDAQKIWAKLGK